MARNEPALQLVLKQQAANPEKALELALEAWRTWRDPRIAAVVDSLSDRLKWKRGTSLGKSSDARREQWLALAAKKDPADLGRLTPLVASLPTKQSVMIHLDWLVKWPMDPRLVALLLKMLETPRVSGSSSAGLWKEVFDRLCQWPDPRALPLLRELERSSLKFGTSLQGTLSKRAARAGKVIEAALAKLPPLPEAEATALTALETALDLTRPSAPEVSADQLGQLLAAVYEEPADDGRRRIFQDAVAAHDAKRAELIGLQFERVNGEPGKRELSLVKGNWKRWSGPLSVCCSQVQFARGFPSTVVLRGPTWRLERVCTAPEWETVEEIDASALDEYQQMDIQVLFDQPLKALKRITNLHPDAAASLNSERTGLKVVSGGVVTG